MLFSSLTFLYAFLPLSLLLYAMCRTLKERNFVLLVTSLAFYAWADPKYVVLLVFTCFFDWFAGRRIDWAGGLARKLWLGAAVIVNVGLLVFFRYAKLLGGLTANVPEFIKDVFLPLGIAFYTLQLISYLVDVYRGDVAAEGNPLRILLFAGLYHQCLAGPIVRYRDIHHELFVKRSANASIADGVKRFAWGLGKKVLLANACAALADKLLLTDAAINGGQSLAQNVSYVQSLPVAALWIGMLAFTLRIYLDFSAYSDMAIGLGLMLGLHYPENFRHPYISCSVTEFWQRWFLSLSSFFRDYVYAPLGGSGKGVFRMIVNLLIVWALTGLWHGPSWTYALWGVYFFAFLMIERLFTGELLERLPKPVSWFITFFIVLIGWTIFKFNDMSLLLAVFKGMLGLNGNPLTSSAVNTLALNSIFLIVVSAIVCTPLLLRIGERISDRGDYSITLKKTWNFVSCSLIPVILLLLSTAMLVGGGSYTPLIYFNF